MGKLKQSLEGRNHNNNNIKCLKECRRMGRRGGGRKEGRRKGKWRKLSQCVSYKLEEIPAVQKFNKGKVRMKVDIFILIHRELSA